LPIPEVPPPKNILGFSQIVFSDFHGWDDVDQQIVDFFRLISPKLKQMTILLELAILYNNSK
jgi:hypothetical protein